MSTGFIPDPGRLAVNFKITQAGSIITAKLHLSVMTELCCSTNFRPAEPLLPSYFGVTKPSFQAQDTENLAYRPYSAKVFSYGTFLIGSSVRIEMQPDDPFPLERCSGRLKAAVLAEFQGRCPTFQEMFSIPSKEWLTVPGIGEASLRELEAIMGMYQDQAKRPASPRMSDAELLIRLERLQRDLERLRHEIQTRLGNVPQKQSGPDKSNHH
jgi:hypothetical protein